MNCHSQPFLITIILDKQQTIIIQGGGDGLWVGRGRGGRAEKNICYFQDHNSEIGYEEHL